MRIGIAGDWHGDVQWALLALETFAAADIETIAHLGDFGLWHGEEGTTFLTRISRSLKASDQTIYVTLGNHENYDLLEASALPIKSGEDAGWVRIKEYPRILFAPRGHRWIWGDKRFVSLGGANSIDRAGRQWGTSWWRQEQISYSDVQRTRDGGHADVMLSHDAPAGFEIRGSDDIWSEASLIYAAGSRKALRGAVDAVKPDILFHGHHHQFLDVKVELEDENGESYTLNSIGLDKDWSLENLGVLDLDEMKFTILDPVK
jgi:predicted phosphodiesterase